VGFCVLAAAGAGITMYVRYADYITTNYKETLRPAGFYALVVFCAPGLDA
jgi:hypothetical protein